MRLSHRAGCTGAYAEPAMCPCTCMDAYAAPALHPCLSTEATAAQALNPCLSTEAYVAPAMHPCLSTDTSAEPAMHPCLSMDASAAQLWLSCRLWERVSGNGREKMEGTECLCEPRFLSESRWRSNGLLAVGCRLLAVGCIKIGERHL